MTALALAIRALWWRRGVSLVVLGLATFVTAAAAAGPIYLRAAGESILQDGLRSAAATSVGIEARDEAPATPGQLTRLGEVVREARTGLRFYPTQIGALEADIGLLGASGTQVASTRLVYREDACAHITVVRGACPSALGHAAVSEETAFQRGWELGDEIRVTGLAAADDTPRTMRVHALYRPVDVNDGYWFDRNYFAVDAADRGEGDDTVDSVFVAEVTFAGLPPSVVVRTVVDLPLDRSHVDLSSTDDALRGVDVIRDRLRGRAPEADVDTSLEAVLAAADRDRDALEVPIVLIVLQLLVLSWFVLFMVVASSAEARAGEIALAKVRGLGAAATVAFGLLETLVLLVLAIPLGLLAGIGAVGLLADAELLAGTPVRLVPLGIAAAAAAALGGLIAAALAAARTIRTPVLELWRRTASGRRGSRRSLAGDAAVLALAGAGLLQLWRLGSLRGVARTEIDVTALLAPGLLALGVALIGARVLPVISRAGFRPTRGSRRIGLFVGLRQVARRPSGLRVVVILTVAFGLATFAVLGYSVLASNRDDRALAETGAARALSVRLRPGTDFLTAVRAADPRGSYAMAVVVPDTTSSTQQLVGVDTERFAAVAYWRPDFADGPIGAALRKLRPPAPDPVVLTGDAVGVRLSATQLIAASPIALEADVQRSDGVLTTAALGVVRTGPARSYRGAVTGCDAQSCRLVRIRLQRPPGSFEPVSGTLVFEAVEQGRTGAFTEVAIGSFRTSGRWWSLNRGDYAPPDSLLPGSAGLRFDFSAPSAATIGVAPVDVPVPLPALVTRSLLADEGDLLVELTGLDRTPLTVERVATAEVIPRGGRSAALVDLEYLQRQSTSSFVGATREVWLATDAPAEVRRKLAEFGVTVTRERSASDRESALARQAPSLALLLFLVGAGVAALLAAGGTVVDVYLLGRRRAYELAAMLAVGVRRRSLLAGVLIEQALLIGTGTVLGVTTGYVGARLALPSVPLYTDGATFPPPLYEPDARIVVLVGASVVVVMGLAVLVAARLLVRAAVPSRLREAQA